MDMLKMKHLMAKKKSDEDMSDMEKEAKMNVVKHMRDMASNGLTDKLKNLKKVTVAGNNKEALEMGLEKAREMVGKTPEGSDSREEQEETPEEDALESPEMEASEHEMMNESPEHDYSAMSEDELQKCMDALMEEKNKRNS